MDTAYSIHNYGISRLKEVLAENTEASRETIDGKLHSTYFENYFEALKAKTFLVEYE